MPNNELIDIVDDKNQLLGILKRRNLIHSELTDWHRVTSIWILNDKNEILCQQRSLKKDSNPGKWQSYFGGHLKAGQTYGQNAVAELKEELGLEITKQDLLDVGMRRNKEYKHFTKVFLLHWNGSVEDLTFNDGEVLQVKWLNTNDLLGQIKDGLFVNSLDLRILSYLENQQGYKPVNSLTLLILNNSRPTNSASLSGIS